MIFNRYFFTPSFENRFNESYSIIQCTQNNFEKVRLFGLCETHTEATHKIKNSWLIHQLYRRNRGDVVLIEGLGSNQDGQGDEPFLLNNRNIIVKGWDSDIGLEKLNLAKYKMAEDLVCLKELYENPLDSVSLYETCQKLFYELPEDIDIMDDDIRGILHDFTLLNPNNQEQLRKWFVIFSDSLYTAHIYNISKTSDETMIERNASLVKTIESNLTGSNKVFVISGALHLKTTKSLQLSLFNKESIKAIQITQDFFKGNASLIIKPNKINQSVPDMERILLKLKRHYSFQQYLTAFKTVALVAYQAISSQLSSIYNRVTALFRVVYPFSVSNITNTKLDECIEKEAFSNKDTELEALKNMQLYDLMDLFLKFVEAIKEDQLVPPLDEELIE